MSSLSSSAGGSLSGEKRKSRGETNDLADEKDGKKPRKSMKAHPYINTEEEEVYEKCLGRFNSKKDEYLGPIGKKDSSVTALAGISTIISYACLGYLDYVKENGLTWNDSTMHRLYDKLNREGLIYLRDNGYEIRPGVSCGLAEHGYKKCLKWYHENGYKWHPMAATDAAMRKQLGSLKYLHEHGATIDEELTATLASHGYFEQLKIVYEMTGFMSNVAAKKAAEHRHADCLKFIYENCADEITWEMTGLEDHVDNYYMPYLTKIIPLWRAGQNKSSTMIKPAKRSST
jgi:hypothetical protein